MGEEKPSTWPNATWAPPALRAGDKRRPPWAKPIRRDMTCQKTTFALLRSQLRWYSVANAGLSRGCSRRNSRTHYGCRQSLQVGLVVNLNLLTRAGLVQIQSGRCQRPQARKAVAAGQCGSIRAGAFLTSSMGVRGVLPTTEQVRYEL
jgi:hypothetical protein